MYLVAVDVNISNYIIGTLARSGDMIVCVAKISEPDEKWLDRALARGAEVIISQDLDIPNLLDHWDEGKVRWFETVSDYLDWREGKK